MKYNINPELQRYTWLEFSWQRLIAMPLVIGIIFYLVSQGKEPAQNMAVTAQTIFMVLVGLWGGHKVAESVIDEVNDNTWDFQRLSSLTPWSITWGKLIGSPIYCWYGAVIALVMYTWHSSEFLPEYFLLCNTVLLLTAGFICHALALLSSMQAVQMKLAARGRMRVIGHHIIGMGFGLYFISYLKSYWEVNSDKRYMTNYLFRKITWYGEQYDLTGFVTVFSIIVLAWLVSGAYWQMRMQLRMRTGPWLWMAFSLFMLWFIAGFSWDSERMFHLYGTGALASYAMALFFLYAMVFMEPWNGVSYRRLINHWKTRNYKDFANNFPRWIVSLALVVLTMIGVFFTTNHDLVVKTALALTAFAIRDIALLHYFMLAPNNKRATAATMFYLAILYVLLPLLFTALHMQDVTPMFLPLSDDIVRHGNMVLSILSAIVQSTILIVLALKRWKKHWRQLAAPA